MTVLRNPLKHDPAAASNSKPNLARNWFILISVAILVSYLYAFLEWSFFITQPSYASVSTNLIIKLTVLFFSGFIISGIFASILIALFLIFWFIPSAFIQGIGVNAGRSVLAFLLACLALLLIDNFTYTLFKVGIISSTGIWRAAYALLFVSLLIIAFFQCAPLVKPLTENAYHRKSWQLMTAFGLILASILFVLTTYLNTPTREMNPAISDISANGSDRPNIIIIGSDGVNASNMSLYGYQRDTTPNLVTFAHTALLAENAFHNANTSTGSDTSLLTGKFPTSTRVMFPPDILLGANAYEHLPAILKKEGYHTVEIGMPHYVDAYGINFQEGFDLVNGRSIENYPMLYLGWKIGGDYPAYFIGVTTERILTRLKHIFFIETIVNPFEQVTTGYGLMMTDQERIDQLIALLQNRDRPLFAHVHLMGTHGPYYYPVNPYYSNGQVQAEPKKTDFYDDAIRDFDGYLGQLFTYLESAGLRENTVLVVYSDHGQDLTINRVPLVFKFPDDEFSGVIKTNVQNLDIAPTLLDYLNFPIPEWMEGDSLLSADLTSDRAIFIPGVNFGIFIHVETASQIDPTQITPPWYQFGTMRMNVCDHYYQVILINNFWEEGRILGHTAPCDPTTLPTMDEARQEMLEHLVNHGFDVSSLED